jgi:hypothetical protein
VFDMLLKTGKLPEQGLLFQPGGGQLAFEFPGPSRCRLRDPLCQALPEMLEGTHRIDLGGAMPPVIIVLLLLPGTLH